MASELYKCYSCGVGHLKHMELWDAVCCDFCGTVYSAVELLLCRHYGRDILPRTWAREHPGRDELESVAARLQAKA